MRLIRLLCKSTCLNDVSSERQNRKQPLVVIVKLRTQGGSLVWTWLGFIKKPTTFFSTATILGATSFPFTKWESGQALAHGPWHLYTTLRRLNCCSHCFIAVCCLHGNSQAAVAKKEECDASDGVGPAGCAPCSHTTALLFHPDVDESQQRLHLMMFSTRSLFF